MDEAEYRPGACNIGRREQRRRLALGVAAGVAALAYTAWVLGTDQSYRLLAGTGVLLTGAFLGYLQYRLRFCAGLAALGRYDLSGSGGDAGAVPDREHLRRDRLRALQLVLASVALAVLATVGVYLLDLFVLDPPRA